jgi:hypothetical protein
MSRSMWPATWPKCGLTSPKKSKENAAQLGSMFGPAWTRGHVRGNPRGWVKQEGLS